MGLGKAFLFRRDALGRVGLVLLFYGHPTVLLARIGVGRETMEWNSADELIGSVIEAAKQAHPEGIFHLVMFLSNGKDWTAVPLLPDEVDDIDAQVGARLAKGMYLIGTATYLYEGRQQKVVPHGRGKDNPKLLYDAWEQYDATLRKKN